MAISKVSHIFKGNIEFMWTTVNLKIARVTEADPGPWLIQFGGDDCD